MLVYFIYLGPIDFQIIFLQVVFLQDTVRKECEERFELTEKLSEAREELLQLKKPSGD